MTTASPSGIPNEKHLYKVDVLRGIAILFVFLYHTQVFLSPDYVVEHYNNGVLKIDNLKDVWMYFSPVAFGWTGVELFLLISGFLIHYGFLKNGERFNIQTFFSKRFWRIYPPYLLALFFFCGFGVGASYYLTTGSGLLDLGMHVFLLHNLLDRTFFTINTSFWSLALEAQLYLLYPFFLILRKHTGITKTFWILLIVSIILFIVGATVHHLNGWNSYSFFVIKTWFMWAAGAWLAERYHSGKTLLGRYSGVLVTVFFLLLCLSKYFAVTKHVQPYCATFMWLAFFEWFIRYTTWQEGNRLMRAFTFLGLCSYSFYLIHQPLLNSMLSYLRMPFYENDLVHSTILVLACMTILLVLTGISYLLYRFVELPSIAFGSRLRKRAPK